MDREKIHINVARLKKAGDVFEVVVNPDAAVEYRRGSISDISSVLKSESVFSDAKKGLAAPQSKMKLVFGTDDALAVAKVIINEGEIQLTKEHHDRIKAEKRKRILHLMHINSVDSKTGKPFSEDAIGAAMDKAGIKVDEYRLAEAQLDEIVKQLKPAMPIKFSVKQMKVKVRAKYASHAASFLKQYAKLLSTKWNPDGSLEAMVEVPGGLETEFCSKMDELTHGENECEVISTQ
jgi:ribosome maturation protein SDO1